MKALIIHDNRTFAAKTCAMLHWSADDSERIVRWSISLWHMEMLKRPPFTIQALREAADAHLIILALRSAEKLSGWLMDWLEQWAKARLTLDVALALIREEGADIVLTPSTSDLSLFAKRHNLCFIGEDRDELENRPEFFVRSLLKRETTLSPASFQIVDMPTHDGYRGWGINE